MSVGSRQVPVTCPVTICSVDLSHQALHPSLVPFALSKRGVTTYVPTPSRLGKPNRWDSHSSGRQSRLPLVHIPVRVLRQQGPESLAWSRLVARQICAQKDGVEQGTILPLKPTRKRLPGPLRGRVSKKERVRSSRGRTFSAGDISTEGDAEAAEWLN
jgi:hypothetical protein